jgi:hypothetical protein
MSGDTNGSFWCIQSIPEASHENFVRRFDAEVEKDIFKPTVRNDSL